MAHDIIIVSYELKHMQYCNSVRYLLHFNFHNAVIGGILGLSRIQHKNHSYFKKIKSLKERIVRINGKSPVSYTHLTLPTTPYV